MVASTRGTNPAIGFIGRFTVTTLFGTALRFALAGAFAGEGGGLAASANSGTHRHNTSSAENNTFIHHNRGRVAALAFGETANVRISLHRSDGDIRAMVVYITAEMKRNCRVAKPIDGC